MPLAAGSKLPFYEMIGPLGMAGTGAMREDDRAKNTRLGREVAVEVVPEYSAAGEARSRPGPLPLDETLASCEQVGEE